MNEAEKERMREHHRQRKAKRYREHMNTQHLADYVGIAKEFIPAGSLVYFNGEQLGTVLSPLDVYLKSIAPTFEDLALSGPFLGIGDEGDRVNGRIKSTGLAHLKKTLQAERSASKDMIRETTFKTTVVFTAEPTGEEEAPGWGFGGPEILQPTMPKGKPPTPTPGEIAEAKEEDARGWRVVGVDNFDRETVSDFIMCECPDEARAILICASLNKTVYDHSPTYYRVYKPGKELFTWTP